MKILKENYDEMLNLISSALKAAEYNINHFSKGDVEREAIAWKEFSCVIEKLAEAGVNFDNFVLPITNAFEIELNGDKLADVRMKNTSNALPEDLNIEVECPLLESVKEWAYGEYMPDICRIKVVNN